MTQNINVTVTKTSGIQMKPGDANLRVIFPGQAGVSGELVGVKGDPGPQGEQGPPGNSAEFYNHIQQIASNTWTILHNLGRNPSITAFDTAGDQIIGLLTYDSINQATLTFSAPVSGAAYCN